MKPVVISADGERKVYAVPDVVADHLEDYCQDRFPDTPSTLVENLGWIDFDAPLPQKYRNCPWFNF